MIESQIGLLFNILLRLTPISKRKNRNFDYLSLFFIDLGWPPVFQILIACTLLILIVRLTFKFKNFIMNIYCFILKILNFIFFLAKIKIFLLNIRQIKSTSIKILLIFFAIILNINYIMM